MVQHTSLPAETAFALKILEDEYQFFNNAFNLFFPEIIHFVETIGDFKIDRPVFEMERWRDGKKLGRGEGEKERGRVTLKKLKNERVKE